MKLLVQLRQKPANAQSIQDEISARAVADTQVRTDMTALINSGDAATLQSAKDHDDLLIGDATVDGSTGHTVTDRIATVKAEAIADADASVAAEQVLLVKQQTQTYKQV